MNVKPSFGSVFRQKKLRDKVKIINR